MVKEQQLQHIGKSKSKQANTANPSRGRPIKLPREILVPPKDATRK